MNHQAVAPAAAATPIAVQRRKVVAVVGDNCLDAAAMEPGMAAGDEQCKQQLAEEVSVVSNPLSVKSAGLVVLCALTCCQLVYSWCILHHAQAAHLRRCSKCVRSSATCRWHNMHEYQP
jgi:hypothetical protein